MRVPATIRVTNIIGAPANIEVPTIIGVQNIMGAPANIEVPTNTRTNFGVRTNIGAPVFNCVLYIRDDPGNMDAAAIREKIPALTCPA